MGWFFAALVDVLEFMPDSHPAKQRLIAYTNAVADGLKVRQDPASGCWYQLLQYDGTKKGTTCQVSNYLESSASCMITYAYLKGMRLGILDKNVYRQMAEKAYKGVIDQFVVEESDGKIKLIQSCEFAGLSSTRKGDANYYLCGSDVGINNDTEGKVLGPFIMASLEYERSSQTYTLMKNVQSAQPHCIIKKYGDTVEIFSTQQPVQSVYVFDCLGNEKFYWKGKETDQINLNLAGLPQGIYFFKINADVVKYLFTK